MSLPTSSPVQSGPGCILGNVRHAAGDRAPRRALTVSHSNACQTPPRPFLHSRVLDASIRSCHVHRSRLSSSSSSSSPCPCSAPTPPGHHLCRGTRLCRQERDRQHMTPAGRHTTAAPTRLGPLGCEMPRESAPRALGRDDGRRHNLCFTRTKTAMMGAHSHLAGRQPLRRPKTTSRLIMMLRHHGSMKRTLTQSFHGCSRDADGVPGSSGSPPSLEDL